MADTVETWKKRVAAGARAARPPRSSARGDRGRRSRCDDGRRDFKREGASVSATPIVRIAQQVRPPAGARGAVVVEALEARVRVTL